MREGCRNRKARKHRTALYTLALLLLTPYPINSNNSPQQGLRGSHRVACHRASAFIWVGGTSLCVCVCVCWKSCCWHQQQNACVLHSLSSPTQPTLPYCKSLYPHIPVNMCWIKPHLPTEQPLLLCAVHCSNEIILSSFWVFLLFSFWPTVSSCNSVFWIRRASVEI